MAGGNTLALPNYHMESPFPVEQQLVGQMGGDITKSAYALPQLMMYMAQRNEAQRGYEDDLAVHNKMAQQNLDETQADNQRQRVIEILKNPGMLAAASSNGLLGTLLSGSSPDALREMFLQQRRLDTSKSLHDAGQGAQGALAGGIQVAPADFGTLTGLNVSPGTPPIVQAANINAAGRVAAAGASSGSKTTDQTILSPTGENVGGTHTVTYRSGTPPPGLKVPPPQKTLQPPPSASLSAIPSGQVPITPANTGQAARSAPQVYKELLDAHANGSIILKNDIYFRRDGTPFTMPAK